MFENFVTRTDKGSVEYCADLGMAFEKAKRKSRRPFRRLSTGLKTLTRYIPIPRLLTMTAKRLRILHRRMI